MCRSSEQGGRRCPGTPAGGRTAGGDVTAGVAAILNRLRRINEGGDEAPIDDAVIGADRGFADEES
jgi:hypothetical protein